MSTSARNLLVLVAFGFCLGAGQAWGDPETKAPAAEAAAAEGQTDSNEITAERIKTLIKQLNDDTFAARQAASRQLHEAGGEVIPDLVKAAQGSELEVTTRALDLLEKFLTAGDAETQTAAREALDKLAASEHETAAARAAKILEKTADSKINRLGGRLPGGIQIMPGPGGIQIGGGQIQIQVQAIGGGAKVQKFRMQNVNGVKTINAEENGQKVKIVDDPNAGITIDVTEKKDGKETTKTYKAKNADELKKKHPEAHKLYKKYSAQGGVIQLQGLVPGAGRRIRIGRGGGIQVVPMPKAKKPDDAKKPADDASEAKDEDAEAKQDDQADDAEPEVKIDPKSAHIEHLKKTAEQLRQLSKDLKQRGIAEHAERLESTIKQLEELQKQIADLAAEDE